MAGLPISLPVGMLALIRRVFGPKKKIPSYPFFYARRLSLPPNIFVSPAEWNLASQAAQPFIALRNMVIIPKSF